jgi:predicted PilT family ATPase
MPAEIGFYIPETHHKRIIGVGGKSIQRIMKQFGVYVKFSGGASKDETNVIARTPAKNKNNLVPLRQALFEFINSEVSDSCLFLVLQN